MEPVLRFAAESQRRQRDADWAAAAGQGVMTYTYRKRTRAQVDQHLRRYRLNTLAPLVPRDGRAKRDVCDLLRAGGLDAVADLVERGSWPKRGAPVRNEAAEAVRYIVAVMRGRERLHRTRNGGRLHKSQRRALLDW